MGWFDEQLRYRRNKDDANFAEAIDTIADAVLGVRGVGSADSRAQIGSAIDGILDYYRCKYQREELPPQIVSFEQQLEYRTQPFGLAYRKVVLERGWQRDAVGAMIGRLKDDGGYVALIPNRFRGYSYIDPKTGDRVRVDGRAAQGLEAEAVCFYRPLPLKSIDMGDLLRFMWEQMNSADVILYLGMIALTTLLGLLSPLLNKWLFGDVLASGSLQALMALTGFMISYTLCRVAFAVFQAVANARIDTKQGLAAEAAVMNRILSLPPSFFAGFSAGDLAQRASYVRVLCSTLMNTVGTAGLTSLFSLIYIGQIFRYTPSLAAPSLAIMLVSLFVTLLTTFAQMRVTRERLAQSAATGGMTYATISGIRKIKLAGAEKRMFSRWARQYAREARLTYNPPLFLKLSGTINLAVSLTGTMMLFALAIRNGVAVDKYYAFSTAYGMVSAAFSSMASIAATIAAIRPILELIRPILKAEPEASEGREIVTKLSGGIELSHISFRYEEGMPNVIDDLSLTIRPGQYVAVVGSTGCGKSTLMRLMLGFEKPQKGSVYYDRKDLNRLDLKSLRRRIGVVMQDGALFAGDLYANITITAPSLTLDEAWQAAETAAIADDIRAMPMGMQTFISEGQGGISGGQRQRILIARAIAPKPKILMFDEATSALDNVTQKKISDAIEAMKCTRVVIAHRLSTIRHADRILYLEKGRIVEDGSYEELIAKDGRFASLVARQRLDVDCE